MTENGTVPLWWVVVFLLIALGLGAIAVLSVGGDIISSSTAALLPLLY